jgi:diguanylate cyclase (GGDEF)-like protein
MPESPRKTVSLRQLQQELTDDTAEVPALGTAAVATSPAPVAYLVCISPSGPALGRRYPIGIQAVTLGRDVNCAVAIPDGAVSRTHARIELQDDGRYRIEDLNSTNGTFVNDERVTRGYLTDGDYLRVGQCIYRFLAGGNVETAYHEEIHRLAILDPLTGIHNRRYLIEFLDREVERARRHNRPLSVLLIDADHFKQVNDQFGHLVGDFTLRELAARLKQLTRKDELLARYGGEEFALILPETDLEGAARCGERLRRTIADRPFEFDGRQYPITVSVGAATTPAGERVLAADLLREVDGRLYEAKRTGRNRVVPAPQCPSDSTPIIVRGSAP